MFELQLRNFCYYSPVHGDLEPCPRTTVACTALEFERLHHSAPVFLTFRTARSTECAVNRSSLHAVSCRDRRRRDHHYRPCCYEANRSGVLGEVLVAAAIRFLLKTARVHVRSPVLCSFQVSCYRETNASEKLTCRARPPRVEAGREACRIWCQRV